MTTEELTRALMDVQARLAALERQFEVARDLLSRCLIIPMPHDTVLPPRARGARTPSGDTPGHDAAP